MKMLEENSFNSLTRELDRLNCSAFHLNNLACLNLMVGKANLAGFQFSEAARIHSEAVALKMDKSKLDTRHHVKLCEIQYNLSVAHLHCGRIAEAFDILLTLATDIKSPFRTNPQVWLHLAETAVTKVKASASNAMESYQDLLQVGKKILGLGL